MENEYLNPDFNYLNDRKLCWKHYISKTDMLHWEEYPEELKRMMCSLAENMLHYEVSRMRRGRFGV